MSVPAVLALADGKIFQGYSFGATGNAVGEVVFNTSMTGYQEILTDPSYARQLITLTYPHIGNTGVNEIDIESRQLFCSGLIVKNVPNTHSNWRTTDDISNYLANHNICAIHGIDTRALTRIIRDKGAQSGCIMTGSKIKSEDAIKLARDFPGVKGMDLAKVVTTEKSYQWSKQGSWDNINAYKASNRAKKYSVAAYDYGIKNNILRLLVDHDCEVTVYPAKTPAADILSNKYDGVFLSNGPGDPEPCDYAIQAIQEILAANMPIFGICLGHQLLALASGAQTAKMKFGHHGANHPVKDLQTGKVIITSQNHGFTVVEENLPITLKVTHRSLFDGTNQGLQRVDKPAFSFQGHPEASPGPQDMHYLFEKFTTMMDEVQTQQS